MDRSSKSRGRTGTFAVQHARAMGMRMIAIDTSNEKRDLRKKLGGTLVVVGLPDDTTAIAGAQPMTMVMQQIRIIGSLVGRLKDVEEALDFTVRGIPILTRGTLEEVDKYCELIMAGNVVGRVVLDHVITDRRKARDPPMIEPVVQFHGKWPFHRFLGIQEPFSVLFSLMNFMAHREGMMRIRESLPVRYSLRPYYLAFGYFGLASWIFSMIFHTRDFNITEKLDYFAAGASVLYGLYYTPIRIFRLDKNEPTKQSILRVWTILCVLLYAAHVIYLTAWSWDYTYNMAANVAVGIVQNLLWSGFSISRYRKLQKTWAAWPGLIVAWIIMAMSLELFDFPPIGGMIDAHSLWHLGTVFPTVWWYSFLIKDAQEDLASQRLKA
ncbi:uncharacterized protein Z518_07025 [Rhinocladiella mackenziei CBS 650.93]|uniref:Post-GPI attachment to proteins factor 3 n=1 Tax=Rhinocladiella mackenziei CBS 650.93 TaxID=1442369 RepID=A0A0D2FN49_9EURO|nr:uncharacterized protein Z518_07025 [Rhinocladiella mackenziei CBS 650.93]KIX03472.1 hypothetical protein Z518_07025 [Rhinocladiella mackenziei CBS 650.93]